MKNARIILIQVAILLFCSEVSAQLKTYTYPVNQGQAIVSDKYKVYVKIGDESEIELQVLMSTSNGSGDWMQSELLGRTFSFVNVSYKNQGKSLHFRVEKIFGNVSKSAVISPKSYGINSVFSTNGKETQFDVDTCSKYLSINFQGTDNETSTRKWIKHMLSINIDPVETDIPSISSSGTIVYSEKLSATSLTSAAIIYFKPGYYNLKNYQNGGIISTDGVLTLRNAQKIYIEGGAFVEGLIGNSSYDNSNQRIFGRGILTGRQYLWTSHPSWTPSMKSYGQLVQIGTNAQISGVTFMESPNHGIVGRKVIVNNIKFLGWHSNNDAIRVGEGSEVKNCMLRAVDDHFYNFDIWVHDCVLWAGHNGSILTYGWGGDGGPTYNAGSSLLENIDIINPEWINLGNNNGLIMSQVGVDFLPFGYGGSLTTIMRNIRVEGAIPGVTNLKPRDDSSHPTWPITVNENRIGYLGDLILENITIEKQFSKGLIRGELNATQTGNKTFYSKNIKINNLIIGGVTITKTNASRYFTIDTTTVLDLKFNNELYGKSSIVENAKDTFIVECEDYEQNLNLAIERTKDISGQNNITSVNNGDWASYTVFIKKAGKYNCSFRAATGSIGGDIELYINNKLAFVVPIEDSKSNNFQQWYTTSKVSVDFAEGYNTIKLLFVGKSDISLFNLNWMNFELLHPTGYRLEQINRIEFVPNQSKDSYELRSDIPFPYTIKFYNISGQLVYNKTIEQWSIPILDCSNYRNGIYLVQIYKKEALLASEKLIVFKNN